MYGGPSISFSRNGPLNSALTFFDLIAAVKTGFYQFLNPLTYFL
jgi:hypothetical protein